MSSEKRTPPKHVLQYISRNALRLGATSSSNPAAETTVASTSARHQHEYMNSGSANAMATTSTSTSYPHFSPSSHTGANAVTQVTPQTQSQAQPQLPSSFSQDFPFFTPEFQHPSQ
ncbi:hypothetical protein FRC18_003924 [Serendipita sp. 400]|nr:hypothetical protein FRC18_003924 [Serendipita sp. 400]